MTKDSANNRFEEVDLADCADRVRVTYVEDGWAGTPGVRFQIRGGDGHLRQGPEIPVGSLAAVFGVAMKLIIERACHVHN